MNKSTLKDKTEFLKQRAFLVSLLVKRNIKNQYYRSFIGVLWTVLNPLLNMAVMALVFSSIFGRNGTTLDYPIFILSGNIIFSVMRAGTSSSVTCLVSQTDMLHKTRIQLEIFPTANVLSSLVTFGFSFIALLLVAGFRALPILGGPHFVFHWQIVLVLAILPALVLFTLGLSYFLSALYVFFRDIKHIYSVLLTLWYYLTPIFYSVNALKSNFVSTVIHLNPMYHYVEGFRLLLEGSYPTATSWLAMYVAGIVAFAVGWIVLRALRNKIAANL